MSEKTYTVMEGSLTEDLTPVAFQAAVQMKEAVDEWNTQGGGDIQSILDLLTGQNRVLVRALGQLEIEVGVLSGRITRS